MINPNVRAVDRLDALVEDGLSIPNWLCVPRGKHSQKPDLIRCLVELVSPGPYLELFGRKPVPGWTVFGNEVSGAPVRRECTRTLPFPTLSE